MNRGEAMEFDALETETHEAAHAVIALVLQAAGVLSISIGHDPGRPGIARVEFDGDMRVPDTARPIWNLARAVTMGAGECSAVAVLGRKSPGHYASANEDTAMVWNVTWPWHRDSSDRWSHVGNDVRELAEAVCRRHAEAIRAVAGVLKSVGKIDGAHFLAIARTHLANEACEQSRADLRALAERFGEPTREAEEED